MSKKTNEVFLYKTTNASARSHNDEWTKMGTITPPDDPGLLVEAYQRSFVIGGVVDRIVTTAASGWVFADTVSDRTRSIIASLDLEELFLSYFVTGNFFVEKIRNAFGQVVGLERFLPNKIRVKWDGSQKCFVHTSALNPVVFEQKDVMHIRTASLSSRFYGESKLGKCTDQIALLTFIDQYYAGVFDSGFFNNKILVDENGKLDTKQKEALRAFLEDRAKGLKNAFSLMILPTQMNMLNLDDITNVEKFLKYREDLIQSISIALGIPVDILLPQKASRATKEVSLSELNTDIIWPMQQRVIRQLRAELRADFDDIDGVDILAIDTKNQLDEMKIQTGFVAGGIITPNEARENMGLEALPDGDVLTPASLKRDDATKEEIAEVEKSIEKIYKKYYGED